MPGLRRTLVASLTAGTLALALSVPAAGPAAAAAGGTAAGTFTDLGSPLGSLTIMQGVLGRNAAGDPVIYAVPAGDNARLNVINPSTNQLEAAVPMPGASGTWAVTVASDGRVYIGSYSNAHLYRYDPAGGTMTDLGQPVAGEQFIYGLTAGTGGRVYGGTYPHAHAFAYDPAGGFTDFGSLDPVQQYARSAAYDADDGALFVGIGSPHARLVRIDTATGARSEVTPADPTGSTFSDLNYAGGIVFGNLDSKLVTIDAGTGAALPITDAATGAQLASYPIAARGVSPEQDGAVYFTTTGYALARYDLATHTVSRVTAADGEPVVVSRGAAIAYGWITVDGQPVLYGLAGNYSGGTFSVNPATGKLAQWTSPFRYEPSQLAHVLAGPDGKVYLSAFLNGQTALYDPASGQVTQPVRLGQVEDWTWHDGKVEAGVYPYGKVTEWDPAAAVAVGTNPHDLFELDTDYQQNRPVAVITEGDRLYAGTTPGYGLYGGALTTYDFTTGQYTVARDVVPDQTIAALATWQGQLFGGSSIDGGTGTVPVATQAELFGWDPGAGRLTATYTPVPGARSVNALSVGPDNKLWGLADGTLFVFNPRNGKFVKRVEIFDAQTGAQDGALVWSRDGHRLYGVSGGRFFVVDRETFHTTILRDSGVLRLTMTPDGSLYTLLKPQDSPSPSHLLRFIPSTS